MKHQSNKTYPWPVLRNHNDDYTRGEFYLDSENSQFAVSEKSGTRLKINCRLILTEESLLDLVKSGKAIYVMLVNCKDTFYREAITSSDGKIEQIISSGNLRGKVTLSPFLMANNEILSFSSSGWHQDYNFLSINWGHGDVLAEGSVETLTVGSSVHDDIGTIFTSCPDTNLKKNEWNCELGDDKILIKMRPDEEECFRKVNSECEEEDILQLLASIYLPVLVHVFHTVYADPEEYSGMRWYKAIDKKLEEKGRTLLGDKSDNILADVQSLLEYPSTKISAITERIK